MQSFRSGHFFWPRPHAVTRQQLDNIAVHLEHSYFQNGLIVAPVVDVDLASEL
jgi:hypothetical protein